ncbi:hypothetical protein O9K51_10188 [Purpureocillium lavendulum]|uniref:Uncharacterized protein n=1 Tax=Purpureocillium lavendulum TaxID=1247861 RepID=A0AB34FE47_9HYPO|nr:hypothetical protein O9K51_10188 [Purpureocillium lavendulum]
MTVLENQNPDAVNNRSSVMNTAGRILAEVVKVRLVFDGDDVSRGRTLLRRIALKSEMPNVCRVRNNI